MQTLGNGECVAGHAAQYTKSDGSRRQVDRQRAGHGVAGLADVAGVSELQHAAGVHARATGLVGAAGEALGGDVPEEFAGEAGVTVGQARAVEGGGGVQVGAGDGLGGEEVQAGSRAEDLQRGAGDGAGDAERAGERAVAGHSERLARDGSKDIQGGLGACSADAYAVVRGVHVEGAGVDVGAGFGDDGSGRGEDLFGMQVAARSGVDDAQAQGVAVAGRHIDHEGAGHGVAGLADVAGIAQPQHCAGEGAGAGLTAQVIRTAGEALGGAVPEELGAGGGVTIGQTRAVEGGGDVEVGAGDGLGGEEILARGGAEDLQRGAGDGTGDAEGARERAVAGDDESLTRDRACDIQQCLGRGCTHAHETILINEDPILALRLEIQITRAHCVHANVRVGVGIVAQHKVVSGVIRQRNACCAAVIPEADGLGVLQQDASAHDVQRIHGCGGTDANAVVHRVHEQRASIEGGAGFGDERARGRDLLAGANDGARDGVQNIQAQRRVAASSDVDDQRAGHGVAGLADVAGVAQAQHCAGEGAGAGLTAQVIRTAGEALGGAVPEELGAGGGVTIGQTRAVEGGGDVEVGAGDGLGGEEILARGGAENMERGARDGSLHFQCCLRRIGADAKAVEGVVPDQARRVFIQMIACAVGEGDGAGDELAFADALGIHVDRAVAGIHLGHVTDHHAEVGLAGFGHRQRAGRRGGQVQGAARAVSRGIDGVHNADRCDVAERVVGDVVGGDTDHTGGILVVGFGGGHGREAAGMMTVDVHGLTVGDGAAIGVSHTHKFFLAKVDGDAGDIVVIRNGLVRGIVEHASFLMRGIGDGRRDIKVIRRVEDGARQDALHGAVADHGERAGRYELLARANDGAGDGVQDVQADGGVVAAGDVDHEGAGHGVAGLADVAGIAQPQHCAGEGAGAGLTAQVIRTAGEALGGAVPEELGAGGGVTIGQTRAAEGGGGVEVGAGDGLGGEEVQAGSGAEDLQRGAGDGTGNAERAGERTVAGDGERASGDGADDVEGGFGRGGTDAHAVGVGVDRERVAVEERAGAEACGVHDFQRSGGSQVLLGVDDVAGGGLDDAQAEEARGEVDDQGAGHGVAGLADVAGVAQAQHCAGEGAGAGLTAQVIRTAGEALGGAVPEELGAGGGVTIGQTRAAEGGGGVEVGAGDGLGGEEVEARGGAEHFQRGAGDGAADDQRAGDGGVAGDHERAARDGADGDEAVVGLQDVGGAAVEVDVVVGSTGAEDDVVGALGGDLEGGHVAGGGKQVQGGLGGVTRGDGQRAGSRLGDVGADELGGVQAVQGVGVVGVRDGSEAAARGEDFLEDAVGAGIELDLEEQVVGVEVHAAGHGGVRAEGDGEEASGGGDLLGRGAPRLAPQRNAAGGSVVEAEAQVVGAVGNGHAAGVRQLALVVDGAVDAGGGGGDLDAEQPVDERGFLGGQDDVVGVRRESLGVGGLAFEHGGEDDQ